MTRRGFVALTVFFVAPAWVAMGVGSAQDAAAKDDAWSHEERSLDVQQRTDGFSYSSDRNSPRGDDAIRVEFSVRAAQLTWTFVSTRPGNEAVLEYDMVFSALVEFEDLAADGAYNLDDRVVQRTNLSTITGGTVFVEPFLSGGYQATVHYPLNRSQGGGPLPLGDDAPLLTGSLRLRFVQTPRTQPGADGLEPTETPIAVVLDDYPFVANNTSVALEVRVQPNADVDASGLQLRAVEGPFAAAQEWDETTQLDAAVRPVGVTAWEDPRNAPENAPAPVHYYFAYGRPTHASHEAWISVARFPDAESGGMDRIQPPGNWLLYGLGVLAATGAVLGISYTRLRKD